MMQTFLPMFAMTFFICLFVVLMQFLWQHIDDLVGKGLGMSVIGELFFYAALTMVPLALPLAILLASLMTFGNLGEKFELTAMKASGVSLLKVMRPLIIFIAFVSVGAFFFQNNVLPVAQTKMWTLLYSMRQKSPEMEIPEKVFYDQIPGLGLFVEEKDADSGKLYNLMIYDTSNGVDNMRIIVADSGHISMTADKTHLLFNIYSGEQFENLRQQTAGVRSNNLPYRRESFIQKDILIDFDANFNRMDESTMRKQYIGKNISQLRATIDSVQSRVDSIGAIYGRDIKERSYFDLGYYETFSRNGEMVTDVQQPVAMKEPLDLDSVFSGGEKIGERNILNQALNKARHIRQEYEFKSYSMSDDRRTIRRHGIEMHKKFTLSFACLIFFFIGAPLGAIIRKGGLGLPIVVSVLLFIVYYIIDNMGYKMARDGKIEVVEGIWLSSFVLLPLGVFLTYKAVHDSAVFNMDSYKAFMLKLRGKHVRDMELKEFTLDEVDRIKALEMLNDFNDRAMSLWHSYKSVNPLRRMMMRFTMRSRLRELSDEMGLVIDYLSNTREHSVISFLNRYPFVIRINRLDKLTALNISLIEWFKNAVPVTEKQETD